ncbi:hypothetical protein [Deinococcus multiflagellatus]|uniref:Uncharacterized protein n=1 Tax=Deinococcus multiflagellatus TaxID=1656887 RepID=A0ABW1ZMD3_9DEIO
MPRPLPALRPAFDHAKRWVLKEDAPGDPPEDGAPARGQSGSTPGGR